MGRLHSALQVLFGEIYTSGPNGYAIFLVLTVILCGAAAYVTGRAIAETWRPFWQVAVYAVLIAFVSRFLHYALFHEVFLSFTNYVVDFAVIFSIAVSGYQIARRRLMALQYGWTERTS